jgi:anti-anti-sigma regulatory factor
VSLISNNPNPLCVSVLSVSDSNAERQERRNNKENLLRALIQRFKRMLKITRTVLSEKEVTLQLDGRVTGQWVELLKDTAEPVLRDGISLNVDLTNVSFIDCVGIALIRNLIQRGVRHLNPPLFVAEQLKKCKDAPA